MALNPNYQFVYDIGIKVKEILITGGAGFIGSHLCQKLLDDGHRITVVDDESTGTRSNLERFLDHEQFEFVNGDVSCPDLVDDLVNEKDHIYHLAAAVGVALIARQPIATIERNIHPTQLILSSLRKQHEAGRTVRMFLASTSEVYGKNPKATWNEQDDLVFGATTKARWSYGASKAIDEFLALASYRQYGLPVVIGRFFNVVGPRQSGTYGMVLPRFVEAALRNDPLVIHDDGQQTRCFAHVNDIVNAVVRLMDEQDAVGEVINIGSDHPITIEQLAQRVIALAGSSSQLQYQSYREAYDEDFEDIRHRVPELEKITRLVGNPITHDLDAIITDVIADKKQPSV